MIIVNSKTALFTFTGYEHVCLLIQRTSNSWTLTILLCASYEINALRIVREVSPPFLWIRLVDAFSRDELTFGIALFTGTSFVENQVTPTSPAGQPSTGGLQMNAECLGELPSRDTITVFDVPELVGVDVCTHY